MRGDAEEAGNDVEYIGKGVSGGELNDGTEGRYNNNVPWVGRNCSFDGNGLMSQGAANDMVEGGGVD